MPRWKFRFGRTVEHLRRYRHIMTVLMKYGFGEVVGALGRRAGPWRVKQKGHGRSHPERVRMAMEELGPTFVKLGQLLSTRPDLVPPEYVAELERLQDRVSAVDFTEVSIEIERQLGGKIEDIFSSFDTEPIAAGSISQVYRAVTREGQVAAVKVRRPGIVDVIRIECEILEDLAGLLKNALSEEETLDPVRMVKEFTRSVSKEVDLDNERRNQMRFLRQFSDDPTIHVPIIYEQYCSQGVLTMEYIEGVKPNSAQAVRDAGLDPRIIAARGADYILRQIFEFGFFHADPHPGNFFLLDDNVLAPIDFGQVAWLSSQDRRMIMNMVLAIVAHEVSPLLRAFERADMLDRKTDITQLSRDLERIVDTYYNLPLKEIPFRQAIMRVFELIRNHRVRPPAEFTLMLKSMITIESFAKTLDSDFQIIDHLKPYARKFKLQELDPRTALREMRKTMQDARLLAASLPEEVGAIVSKFRRGQFQLRVHHEHLNDLVNTLDKSSNRFSFSMIIAALLVSSSLLAPRSGKVLGVISLQTLGILGYITAGVMGLWLLVSIIRNRHF